MMNTLEPPVASPLVKPLILVVDDAPQNLSLMDDLLSDDYAVKVAASGLRALKIARSTPAPDLILLDIMMPDMDGYEVCRQLKADPQTRDIPVIFLTAKTQLADEQQGFVLGAVDYITKPISPPIVMARIATHLALRAAAGFLKSKNAYLEAEVARRTEEIRLVEEATITYCARSAMCVRWRCHCARTPGLHTGWTMRWSTCCFAPHLCTTLARWASLTAFC
jgi:putative two-component system response regulator